MSNSPYVTKYKKKKELKEESYMKISMKKKAEALARSI